MNILEFIDQLSFKKLVSLTFVIALILAVPVSVWVVQQQTKLASEALFEKPKPIIPGAKYGAPSADEPQITLVWPFLGKVGDVVLIHGKNFGNNPINKTLKVGNQKVSEEEIIKWTPNLIEFMIPQGALREPINLEVAGKSASWNFPFTIYSLETEIQVTENNDIVRVIKGPAEGKVEIFFRDGKKIESSQFDGIAVPHDKAIISVRVLDKNGIPVPFFVEPDEFGF